jgi:hypothetical protein
MAKPESRRIRNHLSPEAMEVTAICRSCKDISTVEVEIENGYFNLVETRHLRQYGTGINRHIYCICGGEVMLYIPSKIKMY